MAYAAPVTALHPEHLGRGEHGHEARDELLPESGTEGLAAEEEPVVERSQQEVVTSSGARSDRSSPRAIPRSTSAVTSATRRLTTCSR